MSLENIPKEIINELNWFKLLAKKYLVLEDTDHSIQFKLRDNNIIFDLADSELIWQFVRRNTLYRDLYQKYQSANSSTDRDMAISEINSKFYILVPIDPKEIKFDGCFTLGISDIDFRKKILSLNGEEQRDLIKSYFKAKFTGKTGKGLYQAYRISSLLQSWWALIYLDIPGADSAPLKDVQKFIVDPYFVRGILMPVPNDTRNTKPYLTKIDRTQIGNWLKSAATISQNPVTQFLINSY